MAGDTPQVNSATLKSCVDTAVNELTRSDNSNINGALTHVKFILDTYGNQRVVDPTSSTREETTFAEAFVHATEKELAQSGSLPRVLKNFGDANYGYLSQGMHYLHPTQLNQAEVSYGNSGRLLEADFTRDLINLGDNIDHHRLDHLAQEGDKALALRAILPQSDGQSSTSPTTLRQSDGQSSASPAILRQSDGQSGASPTILRQSDGRAGASPDNIVDDRGRAFKFEKLDQNGIPGLVETPRGTMERLTGDKWFWHRVDPNHPERTSLEIWHGQIKPDNQGGWQFVGADGRTSRLNKDGSRSSEYCGVITQYHADGSSTLQFADGAEIKNSVIGGLRRTVKNGVTTEAQILTRNGICSTKQHGSDFYAQIQTEPRNAVTALQPGVVVFSSKKPDDSDKRNYNFSLSKEDLAAIERLKNLDADDPNIVIVRCMQQDKSKGYFYEVYSGLSEGNVVAGDCAAQGAILGRVGQNGTFNVSLRRNAIAGNAIALRVAQASANHGSYADGDPTSSL